MKAAALLSLLPLLALVLPASAQLTGRQVPSPPDAPARAPVFSARALYAVHCAGCHLPDGSGSVTGRVPGLRHLGQFLLMVGGREYLVKVPGVMASGLSDEEAAIVSNWVLATLSAQTVPAGHRPYDAAELATARARPLVDVAAERRRLLDQASARGIAIGASYE